MITDRTPDRRTALKERHRQAIVDAAAALIAEADGTDFTVDELATRADVSRRTIFNHFAGVDDVIAAVCGDVLGTIAESLEARAGTCTVDLATDPAALISSIAAALRETDLVGPMSYLTRVLGGARGDVSPRRAVMLLQALGGVAERMIAELVRRHPQVDPVGIHLLVSSVMSGLAVIHRHWTATTGAVDSPESRVVWDGLLDRLLDATRDGYVVALRAAP